MCLVAAVAGTLISSYSQYQQGQASSKAAAYNAKMEDYNAELAQRRATDARARGATAAEQVQADASRFAGEGRAGFAGGNVDVGSQSVKYWELDTANAGAKDAQHTIANAEQEAQGLQAQGWNARASARLTRAQGQSARNAGYLGAGSSLLAGAAQNAYTFGYGGK